MLSDTVMSCTAIGRYHTHSVFSSVLFHLTEKSEITEIIQLHLIIFIDLERELCHLSYLFFLNETFLVLILLPSALKINLNKKKQQYRKSIFFFMMCK